jgi:hypothetical protein
MERSVDASTRLLTPWGRAAGLIKTDPSRMLPVREVTPGGQLAPVALDIEVDGDHIAREEVLLKVGKPREAPGEVWIPMSWAPVTTPTPLPDFTGVIELWNENGMARLRLSGSYVLPVLEARFGDGVRCRKVVRLALAMLVEQIARRVDDLAGSTRDVDPQALRRYAVDVRERECPVVRRATAWLDRPAGRLAEPVPRA